MNFNAADEEERDAAQTDDEDVADQEPACQVQKVPPHRGVGLWWKTNEPSQKEYYGKVLTEERPAPVPNHSFRNFIEMSIDMDNPGGEKGERCDGEHKLAVKDTRVHSSSEAAAS